MESLTFFQQLKEATCTFCGHHVQKEEETCVYTNVCVDCLEILEEK